MDTRKMIGITINKTFLFALEFLDSLFLYMLSFLAHIFSLRTEICGLSVMIMRYSSWGWETNTLRMQRIDGEWISDVNIEQYKQDKRLSSFRHSAMWEKYISICVQAVT